MQDEFCETVNSIARRVPCQAATVRRYANFGWIESRRLSNGMLVLKPSAADKVRKLRAQRLAKWGDGSRALAVMP
jgi:hypothetical protein